MDKIIVDKIAQRLKEEINSSSNGILRVSKAKNIIRKEFGKEYLKPYQHYKKRLKGMKTNYIIPKEIKEKFKEIMNGKIKYIKPGKYWKNTGD